VTAPVFIGDEVTAAGYRLAGARTRCPAPGQVQNAFEEALADADFVLITAALAAEITEDRLDQALHSAEPLVLVVPDAANRMRPSDLSAEVDRVLGIER
jgi:vacuolar-type H+-ATPase subunit F/Vma7